MKRYISSSFNSESRKTISRYIDQAVRNISNYIYDDADLAENDTRSDYFVDNICEDSEVGKAKELLLNAVYNATDRQMKRF